MSDGARIAGCGGAQRLPMISRKATILAAELALATALAFGAAETLSMMGMPKYIALPVGELTWAGVVLFFLR